MTTCLIIIGCAWAALVVLMFAACRAAARRPIYGPPISPTDHNEE